MVETKLAISASVAVAVRRKLAFEMDTLSDPADDGGEGVEHCRWEDADPGRLESFDTRPRELPRIWVKGNGSLAFESTTWATFIRSTPMRFWSARTVGKWSGGYSKRRKRTSECMTKYVSRWGIMRVARR